MWALAQGRSHVVPDDIQDLSHMLSHRILLHPEAQFEGATAEKVIDALFTDIEPPVRRGV